MNPVAIMLTTKIIYNQSHLNVKFTLAVNELSQYTTTEKVSLASMILMIVSFLYAPNFLEICHPA